MTFTMFLGATKTSVFVKICDTSSDTTIFEKTYNTNSEQDMTDACQNAMTEFQSMLEPGQKVMLKIEDLSQSQVH